MKLHWRLERPVNLVARKKIVFVIVEGPSDEEALGAILYQIFDKDTVHVHITHRDITTDRDSKNWSIINKVVSEVKQYAASNHFTKGHFKEIVHIVDLDGAYIPNSNIVEDENALKPVYCEDCIKTCNKTNIENRNAQKSSNITKLASTEEVWGLPYRVFYMSCNLDHVLYNKQNSSDDQKEADSFDFAKKYKDKIEDFLTFISCSDFSVMTGYKQSWEYIKQDLNSLHRHTNLGLCFKNEDAS